MKRLGSVSVAMGWLLGGMSAGELLAQQPTPHGGAHLKGELRGGELEVRAAWEPFGDSVYEFGTRFPLVAGLAPAKARVVHGAAVFAPFLPEQPVVVGDVWPIDVADVLPLLRQLHAGVTATLHHDRGMGLGAHGGWGCLRVLNERFAEVQVRLHADVLIDGDGGEGSSWFTPSQFRGCLLLDRARGTVVWFRLGVPDSSANVDINIATERGMTADIGRVPRMELVGGRKPEGIGEGDALELDSSWERLAQRFYPFADLPWLDLADARAESVRTGKPLHVIALFGSLLDESC